MEVFPVVLLSPSVRHGLERHLAAALGRRSLAQTNLRRSVRDAVGEMVSKGASDADVRGYFARLVEDHPNRHAADRLMIVTGKHSSDVLAAQVLSWVEAACQASREPVPSPPLPVRHR